MIITTSHATLVNGKIYEAPANTVIEILESQKKDFIFLRHSMNGELPSIIYYYKNGKLVYEKKLFVLSNIVWLRYFSEILSTFFYFFFKLKDNNNLYIGVDPLNTFSGILLKKIGKIKTVIFYTADYSRERFKNKILNNIYHLIDKFCVKNVDEVWNVSSRICKVREEIGVTDKKNIFVPNIPSDEYKKFSNNFKQKYQLITLGIIGKQLDYIGIFDAIKELQVQYPDILLKIVGNGPMEDEYKKYVVDNKLEERIKFLGYMEHKKALNEISISGIGLALYNGNWNFNYYGDSMKCREYFCFGLPVITTDTHSTVEEIVKYNTGIVCKMSKDEYKKAIDTIFKNYKKFSDNAIILAKKYENIHTKLINKLVL